MALYAEFKPALGEISRYLRLIATKSCCAPVTSAGTGDVPEGFRSISIVKTSENTDTVTITLADGSVYTMTEKGEVFSDSAPEGSKLPAYDMGGTGTFKWHGIK